MRKRKYIVVPDIHGQYDIFLEVIEFIKSNLEKDRYTVIFLGDYINRGLSGVLEYRRAKKRVEVYCEDIGSRLVVDGLLNFKEFCSLNRVNDIYLLGNHEQIFLNVIEKNSYKSEYIQNTIDGFHKDRDLLQRAIDFFKTLRSYYVDSKRRILFSHAGFNPKNISKEWLDFKKSSQNDFIWIREECYKSKVKFPYTFIFGHTPTSKMEKQGVKLNNGILLKRDRVGIDSGIYRSRYINIVVIEDDALELVKISQKGVIKEFKYPKFFL